MFYSESAVALINYLKNLQNSRAEKYLTFVNFFELKVPKGAGKKASYKIVKIMEPFLNYMKIISEKSA